MSTIDATKIDDISAKQVDQINKLKMDIQKLIISLSTASLVFSVSLLQVIPKAEEMLINNYLMIGWICLVISIITGVFTLVFGAWEFGNRLMAKVGKCGIGRAKFYTITAHIYKILGHICEHLSIWGFTVAVIFILMFAITTFMQ